MKVLENISGNIFNRRYLTLTIISLILGFSLVTQLRVQGEARRALSAQPESDLTEIIDKQETEIRDLRADISELKVQLAQFESSAKNRGDLLTATKNDMQNLRVLLGLTDVTGPGLKIVINDKNNYLNGFDLHQVVEELRVSGVSAVAINGNRIVAGTFFSRRKGHIYLDNQRLRPPFIVAAIGNPDVLFQAVMLPRGIKDRLDTFKGVSVKVTKAGSLRLPALKKGS